MGANEMNKNIYDTKVGERIKFIKHKHWIINEYIDCSGLTGKVNEVAPHHIIVDLDGDKFKKILADWDHCLVFAGEDKYKNVIVEIIDG